MNANTRPSRGYTKEWLLRRLANGEPTEPNVTSVQFDCEDLHEDRSDYLPINSGDVTDAENIRD